MISSPVNEEAIKSFYMRKRELLLLLLVIILYIVVCTPELSVYLS